MVIDLAVQLQGKVKDNTPVKTGHLRNEWHVGSIEKGFISLMGWITHSDTYEWYLMYIKPLISVRAVKRIISKMDKEANKNARMENRELLLTA